jgi:hypothetical protein
MKKQFVLFIIISFLACINCNIFAQIEPYNSENYFFEEGKPFAFKERAGVIVSLGFDSYLKHELVFDLTIDNQSDSMVIFDPSQVYIFSYPSDTSLSAEALYFTQNPDSILMDINKEIDSLDKKVQTNSIISFILGLAYMTADIVMAGGDMPYYSRDIVGVSHLATQIILDQSRIAKLKKIDNLSYVRCRTEEDIYRTTSIEAGNFHSGKLHFPIQQASYYTVYVPVNNRIYNFRFKTKDES